MIKNIIFVSITFCLFLAVALYLQGVRYVDLGQPFLTFLAQCSLELESFKIGIPDIPLIPSMNDFLGEPNGLEVLFNIFNVIIAFFNFIINVINILSHVINIILQLLQFLIIVLKNLALFKDNLVISSTSTI